ncbi:MAG: heat shock protease DegP/HtrA [Candidatus Scalindua rubra]|uniref:Heat shock protease DegP/HtrA n=1 Tax=Candidatus Scalindua rubra TaxID=1872076 RepID=A0A1E3XD94_9BACT|nr:MAG: heat shock protease DegP/HtrA [Candidatus Scalindua rubra]
MQVKLTNFRSLLRCSLYFVSITSIVLIINSFTYESAAIGTLSETFVSVTKDIKVSVVNIRTVKASKQDMLNKERRNPLKNIFPRNLPPVQSGKGLGIKGQGSGIIYDKKGHIITNYHVIKDADEIIATLYDGREFKAELTGIDKKTNIAVLRIDAENLTPAKFGNSDSLELGEIVLAIGNLPGLGQTVTSGIISTKGTSNIQIAGYEDFIQTDATLNPGNYGGPLVNLHGEVVGISTVIPTRTGGYFGISFAIPINTAKEVTEDLIAYGKVTRGWLGITAQPITPQLQEILGLKNNLGTLISNIEPSSPAANAGIKSGDVVIEYDGKKVKDLFHLRNLVTRTEINKEVKLIVIRHSKELKLNTTIVERSKANTRNKKDLFKNLGLIVQNLTSELAINLGYEGEKGVIITNIQKETPAFKAGLKIRDLIVGIQHKAVTSIDEFYQAILNIQHGDDILMLVKRQNRTSKFIVLKQDKDD